jgi:hypothetical protein
MMANVTNVTNIETYLPKESTYISIYEIPVSNFFLVGILSS